MSLSTDTIDSNNVANDEAPSSARRWLGILIISLSLAMIIGFFGFLYYDQASQQAEAQARSAQAGYENFLFQCVFNQGGESKIPSGTVIRAAGKPTFINYQTAFFRVAGVGDVVFTDLQIMKDYNVRKEELTAFFAKDVWGRGSEFSFWLATTPNGTNTVYNNNCMEFSQYSNLLTAEDFRAK